MRRPNLTPADEKTLSQLVEVLRGEFGDLVVDIRLFGSKARGDATPESDLDVLLLSRQPMSRTVRRRIRDTLTDFDIDNGTVTSLLVFPLEAWESPVNRLTALYRSVAQEGVPL